VAKRREIGQGIVNVVVTEQSILRSTNASQPMWLPGARLSFIRNDLADPGDLPRFGDAMFTAFGYIERLVNNAGLSAKSPGDLFECPPSAMIRTSP
jgi:NAD(P)-dependent dehydrogenase (short-subunit alcohol dehydrogenase family)